MNLPQVTQSVVNPNWNSGEQNHNLVVFYLQGITDLYDTGDQGEFSLTAQHTLNTALRAELCLMPSASHKNREHHKLCFILVASEQETPRVWYLPLFGKQCGFPSWLLKIRSAYFLHRRGMKLHDRGCGSQTRGRAENLGAPSQYGRDFCRRLIVLVFRGQVRQLAVVECSLFSRGIIFRALRSMLSKMNAYTVST